MFHFRQVQTVLKPTAVGNISTKEREIKRRMENIT
jgi:hypothetical protein